MLRGLFTNRQTTVLMENGSLMKVESIAKCSKGSKMLQGDHSAILLTCIKQYSVVKTNACVLFEWPPKTGFTVYLVYYKLFKFIPMISSLVTQQTCWSGFRCSEITLSSVGARCVPLMWPIVAYLAVLISSSFRKSVCSFFFV